MNTLESLKITKERDSHFSKKFWNTFIDKLATLVRPYKVYTALLTQSGTDAPTAQIFENTIDTLTTFEYNSTGSFLIYNSSFIQNKTFIVPPNQGSEEDDAVVFKISKSSNGVLNLIATNGTSGSNNFSNVSIEIRVYS